MCGTLVAHIPFLLLKSFMDACVRKSYMVGYGGIVKKHYI